ncbi:MAG TPA: F0F1 ATP synthase subunit B [Candidatus Saccharimonadales bacterium]|nr:F0F1 ATP synthase subunit B [Candidatus Saccharimonadales bacterium]
MNIITFFAHNGEVHEALAEATAPVVSNPEVQHTVAEATHATQEAAGGLSALGLDLQAFLFQLISFTIVFLLLRQFVFKKVITVLEDRRKTVEDSIKHAAETEEKLKTAEDKIAKMLKEARVQADEVVANGQKESAQLLEAAESKAAKRAETIVAQAKTQMDNEIAKARQELKSETAKLVAVASAKVIGEKLDDKKDAGIIERALAEERG